MSGNPFLPFIPPLTQWISSLFSSSEPELKPKLEPKPKSKLTTFEQMENDYRVAIRNHINKINDNDKAMYNMSKVIPLTQGRFRGASVPVELVDEAVSSARKYNVDPLLMVSLIGRESTFGSGEERNKQWADYVAPKKGSSYASFSKRRLLSGWNVGENYEPYDFKRFLADKRVPGIKFGKDAVGWNYTITNQKLVDQYLDKNPSVYKEYSEKIKSTPRLGNLDSFDLAAKFIKERGLSKYNPGDKSYVKDVKSDMSLLKADPALMSYMRKIGYR